MEINYLSVYLYAVRKCSDSISCNFSLLISPDSQSLSISRCKRSFMNFTNCFAIIVTFRIMI